MGSVYLSGSLNKDTPARFLVFLFLPYLVFQAFNFAYFPFILVLLITGILTLVVTRKHQAPTFKWTAWAGIIGVFVIHVFLQPLILQKDGFGYDDTGALINTDVLWDFTEKKAHSLPSHILLKENGAQFDMNQIKGKTHLVTFWATWCAPCMRDKSALETLKKTAQNDPTTRFIDISFDTTDTHEWATYLNTKKPLGLQLISPSQKATSRTLNFAGIPMYFIVDADGRYASYRSFDIAQRVLTKVLEY